MDPLQQSQVIPFPTSGTALASSRGNYVVGTLIGDGQYGSVYEARGPFDELYALKMYRPANRHYETVKQEWSAEMKRLESFRHPNIVYIYDAFEVNHLFYIALERCDTSLRVLMTKPFPDGVLLEFTRQLLTALAYLHDNGLVHADLHGGNVLVTQVHTRPVIKITDFGVAHQLTGQHWFRPQVANPKILTPELVTAGYTTRQSDLYQLGLLMYRMHTGHSAIAEEVQYHDFTRLIAEGMPRQRAEYLRTPIGNVIAKLLRRRDAYRYQSAREVWDDLRQLRPAGTTGQLHPMPRDIPAPAQSSQGFAVPPPPPSHQTLTSHVPPHSALPQSMPRQRANTPTPPMGAPVTGKTPPMGMPAISEERTKRMLPEPSSQRAFIPEERTRRLPPDPSSQRGGTLPDDDDVPPSRTGTMPPGPPDPPGTGTPFR